MSDITDGTARRTQPAFSPLDNLTHQKLFEAHDTISTAVTLIRFGKPDKTVRASSGYLWRWHEEEA